MGVEAGAQLFDWHAPKPGEKAGFGKWKNPKSPYDLFIEAQGIPIHRDIGVHKVQDLPLTPWKRLGGRGTAIQLLGTEGLWGMYVVEVPGAGALNPERHLYEEIYYVVEGRGTTEVWQEGNPKKVTFEWSRGSLFAIPLNARHQVVNATASPALLLAATTAPNVVNLVRDPEFVLNCPYNFFALFDASDNYFKPVDDIYADPVRGLAMRRTNIIPDILTCELPPDNRRAFDYRRIEPHMAGANFYMKIAQYKTAHRRSTDHSHGLVGLLFHLARPAWHATLGSRTGRSSEKAALRARGNDQCCADARGLVPSTLRHPSRGTAAARL